MQTLSTLHLWNTCARVKVDQSQTLTLHKLEGVHFRLLRRIVAKTPDEHLTRDRVLWFTDVPPMSALLCQKRLRWVGHGPTPCACRLLSSQCSGTAEQTEVALDTTYSIGLRMRCCQHFFPESRPSSCRHDSIQTVNLCTHILLWIKRNLKLTQLDNCI